MILQCTKIFYYVPMLPMVEAKNTLVSSRGISTHLAWPMEIMLILYLIQYLMSWFLVQGAHYLTSGSRSLREEVPPR